MRRIEDFCRNLCHDKDIEEQISSARSSGIITSYTLTTLTAMNARRDANLCLWCDEIWYANHLHSCSYAPDYNCMFTCGKDFEVFAFVKVSKTGLKHLPVKELRDEVHVGCADNMFDEMSRNEFETGEMVDVVNGQGNVHQVFDKISNPNISPSQAHKVEIDAAHDVFDETCQLNSNVLSDSTPDSAYNVFTEMPEPFLSSNDSDVSNTNCPLDNSLHNAIMSARDVFDKMPIPDFIVEMAQAATITQGDPTDGFDERGSHDVSVDYGSTRDISQDVRIGYGLIEDAQLPSAHEVSDEKSQGYSVSTEHSDFESTLCNVHIEHRDYLDYQRYMFAKLATLDGSLFQHLISIGANRKRFSTLGNTLFDDRHLSHKIERCDENIRPCYQLFQGTCLLCCDLLPVNLASQGLNSTLSGNFLNKSCDELSPQIVIYDPGDTIINVLTYLVVFDPRTTGLGGQTIGRTGNRQIFDPGGHGCLICDVELGGFDPFASFSCCVPLFDFMANTNNQALDEWHGLWFYTLEDKGDFRGGEEKVLVKNAIQSTNVVISWFECLFGLTQKNVVVAYTFDSGGLQCQFDCMDCRHSSDFEEVSDTDLALHRHTTNSPILMTIALINSFIFDPGGSSDKILVNRTLTLEGFVEFARDGVYGVSDYNEAATICWDEYLKSVSLIFGLGDVLNHCHVRLLSGLLSWSISLPYYKFKAREIQKGFIWDPGIIAKIAYEQFNRANVSRDRCWRSNIMIAVQFFRISDIGARFVNFDNVLLILMMSEVLLLGTSEQRSLLMKLRAPLLVVFAKEAFGFILIIASVNADARVILIFNLGGYDYWQEMMHTLKAYQYGGHRFNGKPYKDYQCYVFDPGGPLMRLLINAMTTNPQLGMCSVMCYLRYHLSLILEDKDRFEGRVLIHFKNETKGSLVIYPFVPYFPSNLVYLRTLVTL